MSDLVGNPEDRFSRVAAHIKVGLKGYSLDMFPDDVLVKPTWVRGCIHNLYSPQNKKVNDI